MVIDKVTGCRFVVFNVLVIPRKGLVVEPSAIEPIAGVMGSTTSPFFKRFSDGPRSIGGIVKLTSIVGIVLVVLVLGARNARQ